MNHLRNWSDAIKIGNLELKNRIVMAALTRQRCNPDDGIPSTLVSEYYFQRAGSGLIFTQSTAWSQRGEAFPGAGCLYNKAQAQGWKKVTKKVHQKDSKIFVQLYHAGRATHPALNRGLDPWAPSPLAIREVHQKLNEKYPVPIQMSIKQIQETVQDFQKSVILAKQSQFDGIQIHSSTGCLADCFLRSGSNIRTDIYGGSIQNRCRFLLELIEVGIKHFSPQRIAIKLSPVSIARDMIDQNPVETYIHLMGELNKRKIGFVEFRQSCEKYHGPNNSGKTPKEQLQNVCITFRPYYNGIIIANDSFTPETGIQKIRNQEADMISFGKLSIVNPDLAKRIIEGTPVIEKWDPKTFYGHHLGPQGYTDYKAYGEE